MADAVGEAEQRQARARVGGFFGLAASIEDLARVEGISRTLAEKIYQEIH